MKHRFKVLMLACAAVCAITAVSAAAAQADPEIYVNGATLEGTTSLPSEGGPFSLNSEIGSTKITITCQNQSTTLSVHNGTNITGNTGGTGSGIVEFTECSLPQAPACEIPDITTETVDVHLVSKPSGIYAIFTPTGGPFVEIEIDECALEGFYPVNGTAAGFDANASTESTTHTVEFSPAISTAAGAALTFGGKPASLTGSSTQVMSPAFSAH